jgi:outer membrane immunogenic protein
MTIFRAIAAGAIVAASVGLAALPAISAPANQYDWSGIYFGAHAGGAWSNATARDVEPTGSAFTTGNGETFAVDPSGFVGGGHGGWQKQWGDWVLGGELSYSYSGIDQKITSPIFPASDTIGIRVDNIFMAVARLGYADDNWLLYAKGGYASADVSLNPNNRINQLNHTQDSRQNGWTVGGGLEYAPLRNVVLGIDYSYIDLGSHTGSGSTAFGAEKYQVDTVVHAVTGRLSFKFGDEPQLAGRRR